MMFDSPEGLVELCPKISTSEKRLKQLSHFANDRHHSDDSDENEHDFFEELDEMQIDEGVTTNSVSNFDLKKKTTAHV